MHSVAGYHAIVKYISSGVLHNETLKTLSSVQKAQSAAQMAHIEASLGDLVVRIPLQAAALLLERLTHRLTVIHPLFSDRKLGATYQASSGFCATCTPEILRA
jgi:hypothetical protein